MSTRRLLSLFAVLLALAIFAVSALPTQAKHAIHIQGSLHPWLHLFGFAALAFLLLSSTRSIPLRAFLISAVLLFAYATEARESHEDGWPIERQDVYTDAMGVGLGSLAALLSRAMVQAKRS